MSTLGPDVGNGHAERGSDLPLDIKVPLLEVAVAEGAFDPRGARNSRRPGSAKRVGEVDGGSSGGALQVVVGGQERCVERRGQDDIEDLDVPEHAIAAAKHRLRPEGSVGETEAWRK